MLNITTGTVQPAEKGKVPVDIIFAVRDGRGYLPGSEVSEHLRKLSLVEFSFYLGFPALQIAERTTTGFETFSMCVPGASGAPHLEQRRSLKLPPVLRRKSHLFLTCVFSIPLPGA